MKINLFFVAFYLGLSCGMQAQPIDSANAYLGQPRPGQSPEIFAPEIFGSMQNHVGSRFLFSSDGKELYCMNSSGLQIRRYTFTNDRWEDKGVVVNNCFAPTFSTNEDTLFYHCTSGSNYNIWFSVRDGGSWSTPQALSSDQMYYFQTTHLGNMYAGIENGPNSVGQWDLFRVTYDGSNYQFHNMGVPLNTTNNDVEFFIAKDESFMILGANEAVPFGTGRDLYISYKINGRWSNPKSLGSEINDGPVNKWAPFVTDDNKYLFYTRANQPYFRTYWLRFDGLLDSLRNTNFVPYQLNTLSAVIVKALEPFSYTIPNDVFIDDDGVEDLHFEVEMTNGETWPEYLNFDPETRTLSGELSDLGQISLTITATDSEGHQLSDSFYLVANAFSGVESDCLQKEVLLVPNPASEYIEIQGVEPDQIRQFGLFASSGQWIKNYTNLSGIVDISGLEPGLYYVQIQMDNKNIIKTLVVR